MQDLTRIDAAAESGEFAANDVLRDAFTGAERVHVIGLVSDGGVHSSMEHLRALIALGGALEVPDLVVHAFTDGRDTTPKSGAGYLETVAGWMSESGCGRIGSVVGRYYAMDRDKRWDRVKLAYDMLVHGRAEHHFDRRRRGRARRLRARRDRRVHHAVAGGGGGADPARRLGAGAQLPARPDAGDHPRAGRARL